MRDDRPRRTGRSPRPAEQARYLPPAATGEENSDITGAWRRARAGSTTAGVALDAKTKRTAVIVAVVLALFTTLNIGGNVYLYGRFQDQTLERADASRLNGAAQEQARRAIQDSNSANARLVAEGLFPVTISPPTQSPASEIIANSASVQVLADMPRSAIVGEDYAALGAAVTRFYQRQPTITQSGPTPLKVQQLGQQYLRVAAELDQRGQIRAPR